MDLIIDNDVKAVAEFMQSNMTAARLVPVAQAVARLAPILWGRYRPEEIDALMLAHPQLSGSETSPPSASELRLERACAGDGSALVADADEQR